MQYSNRLKTLLKEKGFAYLRTAQALRLRNIVHFEAAIEGSKKRLEKRIKTHWIPH